MEEANAYASAQRQYGPAFAGFSNDPAANANFLAQVDPSLSQLDNAAPFSNQYAPQIDPAISLANTFPQRNGTSLPYPEMATRPMSSTQQQQRQPQRQSGGQQQLHILASSAQTPPTQAITRQPAVQRIQQETNNADEEETPANKSAKKETSHFSGMKKILNPPDLVRWRQRLFDVEDTIVMTEQEFQIYFPHVDNVYSHRSTQRYKRKPFVSHYWDCRMKGRPPGTPKSTDPNVKKRKRVSRQRNLCDVKIKITEYFPSEEGGHQGPDNPDETGQSFFNANGSFNTSIGPPQPFGVLTPQVGNANPAAMNGQKYFTIQRVNGASASGKPEEEIEGQHRHSLEDSDRIKKNTILRELAKDVKEKKKVEKTQSKKATGAALATAKRRSKEHDLKLFGSCYCPFVQRVWIALELKGLEYQYIEVPDLYDKPQSLLEINPRGLVPAIRHGDWGCYESTVLLEYLEDLDTTNPLFPSSPQQRALSRLWSDHVNRHLVPSFYRYLQAQEPAAQNHAAGEFRGQIDKLLEAADPIGPFFLGGRMSIVDVQVAPWILRTSRVLKPYRGWPDPEEGSRWKKWVDAIEGMEEVRRTVSGPEVYVDSYQRYAENRPNTSQVAAAVNGGRGLP